MVLSRSAQLPSQHNTDQKDCSSEDGIQCIIYSYTRVINRVQMRTPGFFLYSSHLDKTAKLCLEIADLIWSADITGKQLTLPELLKPVRHSIKVPLLSLLSCVNFLCKFLRNCAWAYTSRVWLFTKWKTAQREPRTCSFVKCTEIKGRWLLPISVPCANKVYVLWVIPWRIFQNRN